MITKHRVLADLTSAFMLLTRLPMRGTPTPEAARAAWAWPLVGLVVGLLASIPGWLALWLGATPAVAATLIVITQILLTGALHEDGLADLADGFWGGFDPARRLDIMRDSRIGAYGVIALVLSLTLRWSLVATALIQVQPLILIIAAVVSRVPMAVMMRWLPAARSDGLAHGTGRPPQGATLVAVAIGFVALVISGTGGVLAGALVLAVLLGVGFLARRKIGGQTGDVLGATQQLAEIAVLVALTSG